MIKGKIYDCVAKRICQTCDLRSECIFWQKDALLEDLGLTYIVSHDFDDKGNIITLIERRK